MPLLELSSISVGYGDAVVLRDISLTIEAGEIVTLVGANGAGKSTLVKAVSGLLHPREGTVRWDGAEVNALGAADRLHLGIAHVPEGRQIFSGMTVRENLDLGAYGSRDGSAAGQLEAVCSLFPVLRDRLGEVAGNFSGGQQQLLAIGRGLMSKPRLLLLDEPSLGVAPILVAEIFGLVRQLRAQGIAILLAEQNARQALQIANRGYVIENGAITMAGAGEELLASEEIASRYLGVGTGTSISEEESARMAARLRECAL